MEIVEKTLMEKLIAMVDANPDLEPVDFILVMDSSFDRKDDSIEASILRMVYGAGQMSGVNKVKVLKQ